MFSDREAVSTANKVLSVFCISLITTVNVYLVYSQCRQSLFYQNCKAMIIISMAIGDIVLAIFPLVILAKLYFEDDVSPMPCRLFITYVTYLGYLIHFVYGVGLILLGAEVLLRHKSQVAVKKSFLAMGAGGVPWILGLVIVLPLCMARVDYEYGRCTFSETIKTVIGVSVFLPASLALVASVIYNCLMLLSNQQQWSVQTQQPSVMYSVQQPQTNAAYSSPDLQPSTATQPFQQSLQQPYYQPVLTQNNTHQQLIFQLDTHGQGALPPTPSGSVLASNYTLNQRKELRILFLISLVYFVMVVPKAAVDLSSIQKNIIWPDELVATTVTLVVTWLMITRSFVTPMIMFTFQKL